MKAPFFVYSYMHITAIQIAAGLSSRMKGPNKLLQDIGGQNLIQHTYGQLAASAVDDLIIVTGRDADEMESSIVNCELSIPKFVFNSNYEQGMTTSIQAGLKAIQKTDAVMICLSDMPLLTTTDYNVLLDAFREAHDTSAILAPFAGKKKGNPVIFGSSFFTQMAEHTNPNGCSEIVKANGSRLIQFETASDHYFFDIDTPERLEEYIARVN